MAVSLHIKNLVKRFGDVRAVDDITLDIEPGEIFFLLGPSGCGKTTLLRTIAGFHQPDSGSVFIGKNDVTNLPPHRRDTGMVFQSYALWPHMSVADNVAFGLKIRKLPKDEVTRRVAEALESVHMSDRARYKPNQLSGGQQQRVALARALVIEPKCLLLDEPLSNLDAKLRIEMRTEIRRICKEAGLTAIYVTHDQKEALAIADRLAILRDGKIEQIGAPAEVYRKPANIFTAGFIGEANFFEGQILSVSPETIQLDTPLGQLKADAKNAARDFAPGDKVAICVRPEGVAFLNSCDNYENAFPAIIQSSAYQGEIARYALQLPTPDGGTTHLAAVELAPLVRDMSNNARVRCHIPREQIVVLEKSN